MSTIYEIGTRDPCNKGYTVTKTWFTCNNCYLVCKIDQLHPSCYCIGKWSAVWQNCFTYSLLSYAQRERSHSWTEGNCENVFQAPIMQHLKCLLGQLKEHSHAWTVFIGRCENIFQALITQCVVCLLGQLKEQSHLNYAHREVWKGLLSPCLLYTSDAADES